MRIAFLTMESFPETMGKIVLDQYQYLKNYVDIEIYCLSKLEGEVTDPELLEIMDKVHYINIPKNRVWRVLRKWYYFLGSPRANVKMYGNMANTLLPLYTLQYFKKHNLKFDIIHCHFGHCGIIGIFLKDNGYENTKIVTSFYGSDIASYPKLSGGKDCYKRLFQRGDVFLCSSEFLKKNIIAFGCPAEKIKLSRLAIDYNLFKRSKEREPRAEIKLLSVGNLIETKGYKYVLEALRYLKDYDIKYTIVGEGKDRQKLSSMAFDYGVNLSLVGRKSIKEVKAHYEDSDILIVPSVKANSKEDGLPSVIGEGQLMELPVITTDIGGCSEGLVDGKTGFVCPEKDERSFVSTLKVLIKDRLLRINMGKDGRKFVISEQNMERVGKEKLNVYESVVNGGVYD